MNEIFEVPHSEVSLQGKRASGLTEIVSTYCRSIGFMTRDDVLAATRVLNSAPDVLEYFGYRLAGPRFLEDAQEREPEEFDLGLNRRKTWDQSKTAPA